MKKNEYSNEHENMGASDMEEQHTGETKQEERFFQFLYNLRSENPWEERDFGLVFMYL